LTAEEAKAAGRKVGLSMFPQGAQSGAPGKVDPNPYAVPEVSGAVAVGAPVLNLEGALQGSVDSSKGRSEEVAAGPCVARASEKKQLGGIRERLSSPSAFGVVAAADVQVSGGIRERLASPDDVGKFESPSKRRCAERSPGGEVPEASMLDSATPRANALSPLALSAAPTPLLDASGPNTVATLELGRALHAAAGASSPVPCKSEAGTLLDDEEELELDLDWAYRDAEQAENMEQLLIAEKGVLQERERWLTEAASTGRSPSLLDFAQLFNFHERSTEIKSLREETKHRTIIKEISRTRARLSKVELSVQNQALQQEEARREQVIQKSELEAFKTELAKCRAEVEEVKAGGVGFARLPSGGAPSDGSLRDCGGPAPQEYSLTAWFPRKLMVFGMAGDPGAAETRLTEWMQSLPDALRNLLGPPKCRRSRAGQTIGEWPMRAPTQFTTQNAQVELDLAATLQNFRVPAGHTDPLRFVTEDGPDVRQARKICLEMAEMVADLPSADPSIFKAVGRTVRAMNPSTNSYEAIGSCSEKPPHKFKWWESACKRLLSADLAPQVMDLKW